MQSRAARSDFMSVISYHHSTIMIHHLILFQFFTVSFVCERSMRPPGCACGSGADTTSFYAESGGQARGLFVIIYIMFHFI
jgi:hypothetical protein